MDSKEYEDDRFERGVAIAASMLGEEFGERMRKHVYAGGFLADLGRHGMTQSYTDCWSRDGLDRKSRSLVTIGALIGMRQPNELKNHIKIGVANGLTTREIEELLIQLSTYVGFPCVASASTAVVEALRELGMAPDATTSEERGVL